MRTGLFNSDAEVRAFSLSDLPLIRRLKSSGISLDSEEYLSRGLHTVGDAAVGRLSLSGRSVSTLVARSGSEKAIGQYRLKSDTSSAHIVFMTPALTEGFTAQQETVWLLLLDALAAEAGRDQARYLHAEVDENSAIFEAFRRAGFAVYAYQDIWRRDPAPPPVPSDFAPPLRTARPGDMPAVRALYDQTAPSLIRQADPLPAPNGLVYMREGRARGYLEVRPGERGLYVRPYLSTEECDRASGVFSAALQMLKQPARLPVYCCLRRYQSWIGEALEGLGFEPWARQTVLVKHTTSRVRRAEFGPLPAFDGAAVRGGKY